MSNLDPIKYRLREYCDAELEPAKNPRGFYICPFCGSGTGANKTAAFSIQPDGLRWRCFVCNEGGDIFDLEAKRHRLTAQEATRALLARFGTAPVPRRSDPAEDFKPVKKEPAPALSFAGMLAACHSSLPGSAGEKYLRQRGITEASMNRFNLGFGTDGSGHPAIFMPHDKGGSYYTTRTINDADEPHHRKVSGIPAILYNEAALYQNQPCFVVESQLCAISIMQEGGSAVALGGTGGVTLRLKKLDAKKPAAVLILSLDNDQAGQDAQEKLAAALEERNIPFVAVPVAGDCKDPNELLQKDPDSLRARIDGALFAAAPVQEAEAAKEQAERDKRTGPGMIDSFLQVVQTRKYEPIPTGINDIDGALEGGFMRQQLISLGAAPGAGKTALAQWIFEGLAVKGFSCIFLNLEMSRDQIIARSISRYAARHGNRITNVKALRGYAWTDEERAAIMEAAEDFKTNVAPHMIYNPDDITSDLDEIMAYLEAEAALAESEGRSAPFVVLDYLQIITGKKGEDPVELIKRAIILLKKYAVEHNTVVFLIMAHNRDSNKTGAVTMESGRDTSAIEYSGDTQIGLTYTRCLKGWTDDKGVVQNKGKIPDDLTEEDRKYITLKIVKGRFGGTGRRVDLLFDGKTMTYTQTFKDFLPVAMKTPFEDDDNEEWVKVSK